MRDQITAIIGAGLFGLCLIAVVDAYAVEQNIAGIESQADSIGRMVSKYGWPAVAFILSPLTGWRVIQWVKLLCKRLYGRKPHWLMLDVGSWSLVAGLTYWAWSIHAENPLIVALIVACFHTAIVKAIFAYAPKPVVTALQYGVDSDKTMLTMFAGKDARSGSRKALDELAESGNPDYEKTRVLTEAERKDITQPK